MSGYKPFHEYCPEIGSNEYRSMRIQEGFGLPRDEYGFMELYCTDPGCDCRRVIFWVVARKRLGKPVATIAYGWESPEFYVKWMHGDPLGAQMAGLSTAMLGPQSELTEPLLKACEELVLTDPKYVERLKQHYALFRKAVDAKAGKHRAPSPSAGPPKRKKLRWKH